MSLLAAKSDYIPFKEVGTPVKGIIASIEEYQVQDFTTKEPKYFSNGDPMMGVRITLRDVGTVWVQGKRMINAVREAVKNAGAKDIEVGGALAITFTGWDGAAKAYTASYYTPAFVAADDDLPDF